MRPSPFALVLVSTFVWCLDALGQTHPSPTMSKEAQYFFVACHTRKDWDLCERLGNTLRRGDEDIAKDPVLARACYGMACQVGQRGSSCMLLGMLMQEGEGGPKDLPEARVLYERGCSLGWKPSCTMHALLMAGGVGGPREPARAIQVAAAACGGDALGCALAGMLLATVEGVKDPGAAEGYLRKGCDAKVGRACLILGDLYEDADLKAGAGSARAVEQWARACGLGEAEGCYKEATRGTSEGGARIDLVRKACDGDHGPACLYLAMHHESRDPAEADPVKARTYYEKACRQDLVWGCYGWATYLMEGKGGPADPAEARRQYEELCDSRFLPGCTALARAMVDGKGGPADPPRAATLFRKACDGPKDAGDGTTVPDGDACNLLGALLWEGKGVARNRGEARDLFERACELHSGAAGCANAAMAWQSVTAGPRDPSKALDFARRACGRGHEDSCGRVPWLLFSAHNDAEAEKEYARMCRAEGGSKETTAWACNNLGDLRRLLHKDEPGATRELRRGCDLGFDTACVHVASLVAGRDRARAEQLAKGHAEAVGRHCDEGSGWSCLVLAEWLARTGDDAGATRRLAQGLAHERSDCRAGDEGACRVNGLVRPIHAPLFARVEKRCGAGQGSAEACEQAATLYDRRDDPDDAARARTLYQRACDMDRGGSCLRLMSMRHDGRGGPRDLDGALTAGERGCRLGVLEACDSRGWFLFGEGRDDEAEASYRRACHPEGGEPVPNACWNLADLLTLVRGDPAAGLVELKRACDLGEPGACLQYAVSVAGKERDRAAELAEKHSRAVQKECDKGASHGWWCLVLGDWLRISGDVQGAKDLHARGRAGVQAECNAGDRGLCRALKLRDEATSPGGGH